MNVVSKGDINPRRKGRSGGTDTGSEESKLKTILTSLKSSIEQLWYEAIQDEWLFQNIDSPVKSSRSKVLNQPVGGIINEILSLAMKNKREIKYSVDINSYKGSAEYTVDDIFNIAQIIANKKLRNNYSKLLNCWKSYLTSGASFYCTKYNEVIPFTSTLFNFEDHNMQEPSIFIYEQKMSMQDAKNRFNFDNDQYPISTETYYDTVYNNELTLNDQQSASIQVKEKSFSTFKDNKKITVKQSKVETGSIKITHFFYKICINDEDTRKELKKYRYQLFINDKLHDSSFVDEFPLIAIENRQFSNIKHSFNWFPSVFRNKRGSVKLINELSSKFASSIALDMNGTILADKSVLVDKAIKNTDFIENFLEVDVSKLSGGERRLNDCVMQLPSQQLNGSHLEFYQLLIQELRQYCGLAFMDGQVDANESGFKLSQRLDRENQAINSLFSSLDNALMSYGKSVLHNIDNYSNDELLKLLPTYNGKPLDIELFKSTLKMLKNNVQINITEEQYSDTHKNKQFSDLLKLKELVGEQATLGMSQYASLLGIDPQLVNMIAEFEANNSKINTGQLLENQVMESESYYKQASAKEKLINASAKIIDAETKRIQVNKKKS